MWYKPENFFLEVPSELKQLMMADKVWEILDVLPNFIKNNLKPNVAELRAQGDFITKAMGLYQGKIYSNISYKLGGSNKFYVYYQGQELKNASLIMPGAVLADDEIEISDGVLIESASFIKGPSYIGSNCEVRQGAYIRGNFYAANNCVIGHTTEVKNSLFLPHAKAGHFAYIGDSIIGCDVNLGAGTKLANLKMIDGPFKFSYDGNIIKVNLKKLGAIIGDHTLTGCNSVTSPGTILGVGVKILPNITVKSGYHHANSIISA